MKVVAVAIEYLLAGALILCFLGWPFVGKIEDSLAMTEASFLAGGLAYLLGVVADRIADDILERVWI